MKRALLSIVFLLSVTLVMSQSLTRQMVILEIGTGTWCQYCPGAAMGADDLVENGCLVAVIENHNGDPYANTYSDARNTYYGISSFPTAVFDGIARVSGGSHSSSMYSSYLPKYNQRMGVPAHIEMNMDVTHSGLDYTAVITMTKVGTITGSDLKLRFAVTQSHIQQNWQGQTHLNFVNRLMVPNANGTSVDFTSGDVQTVTLTFTMNSAWPVEDCEFVAFVQAGTKEVMNGFKKAAVDLNADFSANTTQINKDGQVNFTNATTGGFIDAPETYEWHFPGATPDTSSAKNPVVTYTECGTHDVTLIVWRGGQYDTLVKSLYIQVGPIVNISATPGDTACWYEPITLDATTPDATYLWSPGGETTPTITIDGSVAGTGAHTYSVTVTTTDGCSQEKSHEIFFDACLGVPRLNQDLQATIYPNPTSGSFTIEMNATRATTTDLRIVNTVGATVYQETGISLMGNVVKPMNVNLPAGVYFLVLQNAEGKSTQKLVISK